MTSQNLELIFAIENISRTLAEMSVEDEKLLSLVEDIQQTVKDTKEYILDQTKKTCISKPDMIV